ncbi:hypothetical protein Tco_0985232 [Tanacetum coccineum]
MRGDAREQKSIQRLLLLIDTARDLVPQRQKASAAMAEILSHMLHKNKSFPIYQDRLKTGPFLNVLEGGGFMLATTRRDSSDPLDHPDKFTV